MYARVVLKTSPDLVIWRIVERTHLDADRTPVIVVKGGKTAVIVHACYLPVLVLNRFGIDRLCRAFEQSNARYDYSGAYTAAYPIKVNQQFSVVQEILGHGDGRVGLEAGSKAELMAVLGLSKFNGLVICNGYKDREYIRLGLIARKLGQRLYLVIEKLSELETVITEAREMQVTPLLGVRIRLASIGTGKWQNTNCSRSTRIWKLW